MVTTKILQLYSYNRYPRCLFLASLYLTQFFFYPQSHISKALRSNYCVFMSLWGYIDEIRVSEYRQHSRLGIKGQLTEAMPRFITGSTILSNQRINEYISSIIWQLSPRRSVFAPYMAFWKSQARQKRKINWCMFCMCLFSVICPLRNGVSWRPAQAGRKGKSKRP